MTEETRKRMDAIGHMNESSDQLINRLIDTYLQLLKDRLSIRYSDFEMLYNKNVLTEDQKNRRD